MSYRVMQLRRAIACAIAVSLSAAPAWAGSPGAVYTATNDPNANEILIFDRDADGTLTEAGSVATGGLGTGAGLGNQGGIVLSQNKHWLFAVNAGSNELSVFRVEDDGLLLADVVESGGDTPISVTSYDNLVYVLHGGGSGGIAGFALGDDGLLTPVPGSMRPLSGAEMPRPAQIGFSPDGSALVVTEKATNSIVTYAVGEDGLASDPMVYASAGETPFGFDFGHRGVLLVTEAFGGAPEASVVSAYEVSHGGMLSLIDPAVPTTETAACWIVVTGDGRFGYTTNTGSGSVTGFGIEAGKGTIALLDADGVTGMTGDGSRPIDAALSINSRYLYVLGGGANTISAFRVHSRDGSLETLDAVGVPMGANGLAAR